MLSGASKQRTICREPNGTLKKKKTNCSKFLNSLDRVHSSSDRSEKGTYQLNLNLKKLTIAKCKDNLKYLRKGLAWDCTLHILQLII